MKAVADYYSLNGKIIGKTARENGININAISNKGEGFLLDYYIFSEEKNCRTENRTAFFLSKDELIAFAQQLS